MDIRLDVDVNLLLTSMMGGETKNAYDIVQQAGVLLQAAGGPIPVLKWGEGPDDDQSPIGCLTLRSGKRDAVRVIHFGQIGRDDRLRQSAGQPRKHVSQRRRRHEGLRRGGEMVRARGVRWSYDRPI